MWKVSFLCYVRTNLQLDLVSGRLNGLDVKRHFHGNLDRQLSTAQRRRGE